MCDNECEIFTPRKGTHNDGQEFEVSMAIYVALKLCFNKRIQNFYLSTNNKEWEDFDDLIVELEYEESGNQRVVLAIQLKHTVQTVSVEKLRLAKGYYSLRKYSNSYKKLKLTNDLNNVFFVLYTTGSYEDIDHFKWNKNDLIKIKSKSTILDELFECEDSFQFEPEQNGNENDFFQQFHIYCKRSNHETTLKKITQLISKEFICRQGTTKKLISFMTKWAQGKLDGNRKLTKRDFTLKLAEILLANYMPEQRFVNFEIAQINLFQQMVNSARLTILQNANSTIISKIWCAIFNQINSFHHNYLSYWNIPGIRLEDDEIHETLPKKWILEQCENDSKQISLKSLYLIYWKAGLVPLFLKDTTKKVCLHLNSLITLLMDSGNSNLKFLIITEFPSEFSKKIATIQTLSNLKNFNSNLFSIILKEIAISVQKRFTTTLEELTKNDNDLVKLITPELLLELMEGNVIGEIEEFVHQETYLEREIMGFFIKIDCLKYIRDDYAFVFCELSYHYEIFAKLFPKRSIDFITKSDIKQIENKNIFLVPYGIPVEEIFELASTMTENYHVFLLSEKNGEHKIYSLKWIYSSASIYFLKQFKSDDGLAINETDLFDYNSNNSVNVISDLPGTGKSTLISKLCKTTTKYGWVLKIVLRNHLKCLTNGEYDISNYLRINGLDKIIFESFVKTGNIFIFIDGFDEVPPMYRDNALNLIDHWKRENFKIWITTRSMVSDELENKFNILPLSICPFSQEEQQNYVHKYVEKSKNPEILLKSPHFQYQLVTHFHSNLTPLDLKMLIETFELNTNYENEIDVLKLYENVINTKLSYAQKKFLSKNKSNKTLINRLKKRYKPLYQMAAMALIFGIDIALNFFYKDAFVFLEDIRNGNEDNSLIVEVTDGEIPVFSHQIYAEYLAAAWLVDNLQNARVKPLIVQIFEEPFTTLRLFFDRILVKGVKAMEAILDENWQQLYQCTREELNVRDKAGRTPLQLACTRKSSNTTNITVFLLPFQDDIKYRDLLEFDAINYADKFRNFKALEVFVNRYQIDLVNLEIFENKRTFLYNCIKYECVILLKFLVDYLNETKSWVPSENDNHLLYLATDQNNTEIIELLLNIKKFYKNVSKPNRTIYKRNKPKKEIRLKRTLSAIDIAFEVAPYGTKELLKNKKQQETLSVSQSF